MLNNKTFRIIASLVIAVLLWAYVIGTKATTTTQEINNIPITLNHTVELNERGLAVSSMNLETIDVEVTGSRVLVSDLAATDVMASVDLATATKGENELNIIVRVPSSIRVNDRSSNKVIVYVEDLVQKQVDVVINYTGTFGEGQEGNTISIGTPQITVSGAESMVNLVANVRGTIDASRLSSSATEITCQLQPVNQEGNPVSGVVLSQETVTVKSTLSETKAVPVKVDIIDNSSDGMVRNTTVPEEVLVVGRADILSGVEAIEAVEVDITNIEESIDIPLEYVLPEGISLSDRNEATALNVKLDVSPVSTKNFTFAASEIALNGTLENYDYQVGSDQVIVTVMDSAANLNNISKNMIKLACDVSELTSSGSVTIEPVYDFELHGITLNPSAIEITLNEKGSAAKSLTSDSANG